MKLVYVSNFFNHYSKSISQAFYNLLGDDYAFLEMQEMTEERKLLGWSEISAPYKIRIAEIGFEAAKEIVNSAEIVIYGGAPYRVIKQRLKEGKTTIVCSERPLKKGNDILYFVPRLFKWNMYYRFKKNVSLLSIGAYAVTDYNRLGLFYKKAYKWGYFPEHKEYCVDKLLEAKMSNSFIWVGRFIEWKHPEKAIEIIRQLKSDGIECSLKMAGVGELKEKIEKKVREFGLEKEITFLGALSPEEVRTEMEESQFYLFTSDRNEGWGVVLSEAMNSCCVPVCSSEVGSVPYLVTDGVSGCIYDNNDISSVYTKIKELLVNTDERERIATNAYSVVTECWSPDIAARRFVNSMIESNHDVTYENGPMSQA